MGSQTYGDAAPVLTPVYSGFVNSQTLATSGVTGSPSLSANITATSPVGSYSITVALGTLAASNYTFHLTTGTVTVHRPLLSVTIDNASRLYGQSNPSFSASFVGLLNSDNISIASFLTEATPASPIGSYPITANFNDPDHKLENYDLSLSTGILSV